MTLHGIMVTFDRPEQLERSLGIIAEQSRPPDRLLVIDNAATPRTRMIVHRFADRGFDVEHVETSQNLGFAGGVAEGMTRAVASDASDDDWILVFDDDDPAPYPEAIADLERFAETMVSQDSRTAAIGLTGARFDFRRGRMRRVPDDRLVGPVALDYVAGGHLPFYRVAAVRDVGTFYGPLFFAMSEIEFGLRLRRGGYSIYAPGEIWKWRREETGRLGIARIVPSRRLPDLRWRRYYGLRNLIYVLRDHGHPWVAARVSLVSGFGKPLVNLPRGPRLAAGHLRLNAKAVIDGWTGRMGRRVEPDAWSRHGPPPVPETSSEAGA
jgi:glycosyltransferase involved in cell wall biosynthesis